VPSRVTINQNPLTGKTTKSPAMRGFFSVSILPYCCNHLNVAINRRLKYIYIEKNIDSMTIMNKTMQEYMKIETGCILNWSIRFLLMACIVPLLLVSGCASLPTDFERSESHVIKETTQTRLGRAIEPVVAKYPGKSGFHALIEGTDAFATRFHLVQTADKTLDIQYYIWHDDLTGKVLHNQLLAAADRGVRVRLLLDDLDTAGKDEMLHIIDAHPNIEIRLFNPFANRTKRIGDFLTDTSRINRRMHNKSLTADNQATIFGGRNIGDEYFDAAEEVGFSDLDVLAIGPVVTEVSQSFDHYWNSQWVYPLAAFKKEDSIDANQIDAFRRQSDAFIEAASSSAYADALRALDIAKLPSVAELDYSWGIWKLVYDQPSKVEAESVKKETHLAPTLKEAMNKTKSELLIVSPYFVPGTNFTNYLVGLVEKGVRVRILTNSLSANDVPLVHAGYMRYREDLVKGGVELYEFKAIKGVEENKKKTKAKWSGSSRASLHGKFLGFDQRYIFVGSFNLDGRSVALNTELGVFFESPKYAQMMAKGFEQNSMKKAFRVLLTDDGDLQWVTLENGKEVRFDVEPDTGFWKRFSTDFLSIFVPESQL
jgi:putative cardiolipin synthase